MFTQGLEISKISCDMYRFSLDLKKIIFYLIEAA